MKETKRKIVAGIGAEKETEIGTGTEIVTVRETGIETEKEGEIDSIEGIASMMK